MLGCVCGGVARCKEEGPLGWRSPSSQFWVSPGARQQPGAALGGRCGRVAAGRLRASRLAVCSVGLRLFISVLALLASLSRRPGFGPRGRPR